MNEASKIFETKARIVTAGIRLSRSKEFHVRADKQFFNILSLSFWKAFWLTMRPYLIFVSGAAGLVGLSFIETPNPIRIVMAFLPLFFSYGLGQALTDCFQTDTDTISSPYRPLVRGIISKKQVLSTSLAGLTLGIIILTYLNPLVLVPGIIAVLGLLGYTFFKKRWWGGPFWNSWIVALLPIIGRMTEREHCIAETVRFTHNYSAAFLFAVVAIFFGYGNFVVMGYLKDVSADRETGFRTFPVVFGWKGTTIYSDILSLIAAFFTGLTLFSIGNPSVFGLTAFITAVAVNLYAQVKIHGTHKESQAHGSIANVVRAFILYALAIVVTLKMEWIAFAAVFYFFFEVILKYRPEKTQV